MTRPALGVCYYPEHWPEPGWAEDARRMAGAGLTWVRIGEFAWSRIEPQPGRLDWGWLDRAVATLGGAGLKVVMGTPTATPPKWLVDAMPDMLPVDAEGRVRGFGSRRHYDFSHQGYRAEAARIVRAMAERYGENQHVGAWQVDNEYDCHGTTLSFSAAALAGFRDWLRRRYQDPGALNRAWGNVFWSMELRSFDEVELPNRTVTEANPAHWMDFRRYASDQVAAFNRMQVAIIRPLSPGRPILHNFMGRTLAFDHWEVGADLDAAAWDAYPLGFLEDRGVADDADKARFLRQGDPDFQAFHHDLYRAVGRGCWWVMEQQPGPVNWAAFNPAPLDGMVRLWTWEAIAHGAECVSYFRWRQAPFAQEQMHAGLLRPDGADAPAIAEAREAAAEIADMGEVATGPGDAALVVDYASHWAWEIQPQGRGFDYFALVFEAYRMLRRAGLSIDILPPSAGDLSPYRLVLIPGLFAWTESLRAALAAFDGVALIGPRTGSKSRDFAIPPGLPPDLSGLDARVTRVETLRPGADTPVEGGGALRLWREHLQAGPQAAVRLRGADGLPALLAQGPLRYLGGWPDPALWSRLGDMLCAEAGLPHLALPEGLRLRRAGERVFAVNYGLGTVDLEALGFQGPFGLDGALLGPAGVAWFPAPAAAGE